MTARLDICLEGIGRDFLFDVKYDHLIAAISSYSVVGANQMNPGTPTFGWRDFRRIQSFNYVI